MVVLQMTGIVCDEGLVQIGYCCTRVSHLSDVAVYRLCPYTILTDQEVYIDGNLKFYSTIIITLTFQYLNKVVEHSIERVCSVQSAMMDMDQQSMHLLMSVSNVMAMHLVNGNYISLLFYSSYSVLYHCDHLQHLNYITSLYSLCALLSKFRSISSH